MYIYIYSIFKSYYSWFPSRVCSTGCSFSKSYLIRIASKASILGRCRQRYEQFPLSFRKVRPSVRFDCNVWRGASRCSYEVDVYLKTIVVNQLVNYIKGRYFI